MIRSTIYKNKPRLYTYVKFSIMCLLQFDVNDIITPIKFVVKKQLTEKTPPPLYAGDPIPRIDDYPIANKLTGDSMKNVTFFKDCGDDDICYSDLQVTATWNVTL